MKIIRTIEIAFILGTFFLSCSNEDVPESYIIGKTPISYGIIATSESGQEIGKIGFPEIGEKRKASHIEISSNYPSPTDGPFMLNFNTDQSGELTFEIFKAVSPTYSDPNLIKYEQSIINVSPILLQKRKMVIDQPGFYSVVLNPNELEKSNGFIRCYIQFKGEIVWADSYVTSSLTDPIYNLINK